MATVTGLTAERMFEMEQATIIDGQIEGDNLILVTRAGTEIDTGSVRGPVGPPGPPTDAEDVGVMKMWSGTAASIPGKYLPCDGTTRPKANFPQLAAILGTLWGPGDANNFVLPNFTDYFPMGGANVGTAGGFADASLPAHTHTQPTHTHVGASHTHTINHDHANASAASAGAHTHAPTAGSGSFFASHANSGYGSTNTGTNMVTSGTTSAGAHGHTVDIPTYSGSSGGASATTTSAAGGEPTGSAGVSPTGLNRPPFKVVPFMIRALP